MSFPNSPYWLLWRFDTREEGKPPKIPWGINFKPGIIDAETGTRAQVDALLATGSTAFDGPGFAPQIDSPYACLDFDNLILPEPLSIWNELFARTYCERSPSNLPTKGHAIVSLDRAAKERLKGMRNILPGLELYSNSGWFTVTDLALNNLPIIDASEFLTNIADHINLTPKDLTRVPTSITGREVTPLEIGRIIEKISKRSNAAPFFMMKDDWEAASNWARVEGIIQRSSANRGRNMPDRSMLMFRFVKYLVSANARDPDLLWAIIKESAVWTAYSQRESSKKETPFNQAFRLLWNYIVPQALSEIPPPPPSDGTIKQPTDGGTFVVPERRKS